MEFTFAILVGFGLALFAPAIHRLVRRSSGWLFALLPLGLTLYFASYIEPVAGGATFAITHAWVPSLGINLSFYVDGLSILFALLISGVGTLVVIYAGGYLAGHPMLGRLYAYLLMFMASMLGVVFASNVITLFIFWELTSLSSYLLIGFDHERDAARSAALQALLVTGTGGLALLAGLLLLAQVGGSMELVDLLTQRDLVQSHVLYLPILLLILAGAFTKSAQFPFHFWLPNAMEAPTPVSAYLHAATMVKAGIYLLARTSPILAGTDAWLYIVPTIGGATMLVGAYLALLKTDLKRILAYTTVSALGIVLLLLGLGTPLAIKAALVFLLAHALYKGALFLVAGAIDHETGTREVTQLAGLGKAMPLTAAAAILAALSMAGLPPGFGFIAKELFFEAGLEMLPATSLFVASALVANLLLVGIVGILGLAPFIGKPGATPKHPHEAPTSLWLGPVTLAILGIVAGVLAEPVGKLLIAPAASAALGKALSVKLALWHGFNLPLVFSLLAVGGGLAIFAARNPLRRFALNWQMPESLGPARLYLSSLDWLNDLARVQTRVLQNGYLRYYLLTIIITVAGLAGYGLIRQFDQIEFTRLPDLRFYEIGIAVLILIAAFVATILPSRLGAVAVLGVVGYGIALTYLLFGAPDLAMTQFLIETLTVILFVFVLYHLPRFATLSTRHSRMRDALVSLAAGAVMTGLVLAATGVQFHPTISSFYGETSLPLAHGRNVVNVILVDFRGLDTLGEITVLAVAGLGVYALLKLRLAKSSAPEPSDTTPDASPSSQSETQEARE